VAAVRAAVVFVADPASKGEPAGGRSRIAVVVVVFNIILLVVFLKSARGPAGCGARATARRLTARHAARRRSAGF
jgi:hypothetical protein